MRRYRLMKLPYGPKRLWTWVSARIGNYGFTVFRIAGPWYIVKRGYGTPWEI